MTEEPKFGSAHWWWAAQADSRSTTLADSVGCWKKAFELLEAENAKLKALHSHWRPKDIQDFVVKAKPCPFCGNNKLSMVQGNGCEPPVYFVQCGALDDDYAPASTEICCAEGGIGDTPEEAVAEWNKRAAVENAEKPPLWDRVMAKSAVDTMESYEKELNELKAKLEFLKEKGITAGMMKTSDKPEPYMVYIIAPGSELDDAPMVMREIESAKTIATLRAEVDKLTTIIQGLTLGTAALEGERNDALQAVEKEKNLMKLMEHQEAVLAAASRRDAMREAAKICDAQAEFARTMAAKYRLDDERYSQWSARAAGLEGASEAILDASTAPTTTKE